jgi:hypothetical protein
MKRFGISNLALMKIFFIACLLNYFGYFFLNLGDFLKSSGHPAGASLLYNAYKIDDFISFNETWAILIFCVGLRPQKQIMK